MLASQHWGLCMLLGKKTPCPHEVPTLRVVRCAERSAAAYAAAFVHMAELTMLESLEVSGWEDPGASADWARLRQLTALTSLELTRCQYPRYNALPEACMLRPEGRHSPCFSPGVGGHVPQGPAIVLCRMPPVLHGMARTAYISEGSGRRQNIMSVEL